MLRAAKKFKKNSKHHKFNACPQRRLRSNETQFSNKHQQYWFKSKHFLNPRRIEEKVQRAMITNEPFNDLLSFSWGFLVCFPVLIIYTHIYIIRIMDYRFLMQLFRECGAVLLIHFILLGFHPRPFLECKKRYLSNQNPCCSWG